MSLFQQVRPMRVWSLLGIGLALVGWQGDAAAQSPTPDAAQMFRSLDTNKDGQLSLGDVASNNRSMLEQILRMAKKPTSGTVSRTEFDKVFEEHQAQTRSGNRPPNSGTPATPSPSEETPAVGRHSGDFSEALLKLCDADGDGRLTRAEWNRLPQLWERLDVNKDGTLDASEREAIGDLVSAPATGTQTSPRTRPTTPAGQGTSPPAEKPAAAAAGLNGVWRGWVVQGTGEDANSGEMELELTIDGKNIVGKELGTHRGPAEGLGSGTYTLGGDGKSGSLDAEQATGAHAGRTYMGVYERTGDTLKWCVTGRGRQRPATMATDKGNYLLILNRKP